MVSETRVLFAVGMWRSGTSLLQAILNQHPDIQLMFEVQPFGLWPLRANTVLPHDWPQRLDCFNGAITRHELKDISFPAHITAREALLTLFSNYAERHHARIIGGKSPAYHLWLPELARIFPEASFVIIWRDPVECCESAARLGRKVAFFSQRGILTRTLLGMERAAKGVEFLHRKGRRVHELVYGELIENPETEVRRICDFLEIPFNREMLDLKNADLSGFPPGETYNQINSGVIKKNKKHEDLLSPDFMAKARRYGVLWRERFAYLRLPHALEVGDETLKPGLSERAVDRGMYLLWRMIDRIKLEILRWIPLSWWKRFRAYKNPFERDKRRCSVE